MKLISTLVLFMGISLSLFAAEDPKGGNVPLANAGLHGYVVDRLSGEALGGVEISIEGTNQRIYTDFDGRFEVGGLVPGAYNIIVSYISYEKSLLEKVDIQAGDDKTLDIRLVATK
jgi:hypothetical protein